MAQAYETFFSKSRLTFRRFVGVEESRLSGKKIIAEINVLYLYRSRTGLPRGLNIVEMPQDSGNIIHDIYLCVDVRPFFMSIGPHLLTFRYSRKSVCLWATWL